MKIAVGEDREIVLTEVYNGVMLETSEGNRIGICMRDDTFEINVMPKGSWDSKWFRVNMQEVGFVDMLAEAQEWQRLNPDSHGETGQEPTHPA